MLLLTVVSTSAFMNPRNPCHAKRFLGAENTCRAYVVPSGLCKQCRLKDAGPGGKFPDCQSIYNVSSDGCKKEMRKYARKNRACDPLRKRQVDAYDDHLEEIDFFLYSICEECCDCVPVGAREGDIRQRRADGTLFDVVGRANCGTHAAVDVCKVWPNVRAVVNWASQRPSEVELDALPDVCPILQGWRTERSGSDSTLSQVEKDTVPEVARPFLTQFLSVARCGAKTTWSRCVSLERNQSRI